MRSGKEEENLTVNHLPGSGFTSTAIHLTYVTDKEQIWVLLAPSQRVIRMCVFGGTAAAGPALQSCSLGEGKGPYLLGLTTDHFSYWSTHKHQNSH